MNALGYLLRKRLKNIIKGLVRSPGKLVLVIAAAALLALTVVSTFLGDAEAAELRDINELYAIILALYAAVFVIIAMQGFSSGTSFYTMSDVNILFNAPISSKKILIYGLVRQMGTTLLMGFFLLFQYGWLHNSYGITIPQMAVLFLGYAVVVLCSQLTAMGIYCFSSSSEGRQRTIKGIIYAVCVVAVLGIGLPAISAEDKLGALIQGANEWYYNLFPVGGWVRLAAVGAMEGQPLYILYGLGATALFVGLFIAAIFRLNADYYEDVLAATETSHSAITAQKEGQVKEALPKNIKIGKTGLGKGRGASAFFYKHLLENRRSRIFLFDSVTLIYAVMAIVFAFFMRDLGGLVAGFAFSVYVMIFSSAMGRWVRELTKPYAYMVPQKPFKKLVMVCGESMLKSVAETLVVIVPICLINHAAPIETVAAVAARIGFALVFIAANMLTERLFGGVSSRVLILFIYIIVLLVVALPGLAGAIALAVFVQSPFTMALAFLIIAVWNFAASTLVLFLCRNILSYAELNNR